MKVKFTILGEPAGKGRPRFRSVGPYVKTYTPEKTASYENLVKLEYRRQCNDFKFEDGVPLDLRITAYYSIPKSTSKKKRVLMEQFKIRPMKKPDNDNIVKVVQDALNLVATMMCRSLIASYGNFTAKTPGWSLQSRRLPMLFARELPFGIKKICTGKEDW